MDILSISDNVVYIGSFFTPIILLPQIARIYQLKEARSISLLSLLGSLALQSSIAFNAYLHSQPQILFSMMLSIIPVTVLLAVAAYYRFTSQ